MGVHRAMAILQFLLIGKNPRCSAKRLHIRKIMCGMNAYGPYDMRFTIGEQRNVENVSH